MKNLSKLFVLALLPFALVGCSEKPDEGNKPDVPEGFIGEWAEEEITKQQRVHESITLPYATNLFQSRWILVKDDVEEGEEQTYHKEISSNYTLSYLKSCDKLKIKLPTNDVANVTLYKDFCLEMPESIWAINPNSDLGQDNVQLYHDIDEENTYYIDIILEEGYLNIYGYTEIETSFSTTGSAFKYMQGANGFEFEQNQPKYETLISDNVSKVALIDSTINGLKCIDLTFTSTQAAADLLAYKNLLIEKGYAIDESNRLGHQDNYYKIVTYKGHSSTGGYGNVIRTLDLFIDEVANEDSFSIKFYPSKANIVH